VNRCSAHGLGIRASAGKTEKPVGTPTWAAQPSWPTGESVNPYASDCGFVFITAAYADSLAANSFSAPRPL
jgi:hypothetical protein